MGGQAAQLVVDDREEVGGRARLDPIQGQPPDLTRLPPGCAFAPRCNYKVERCGEVPPLETVVQGHSSACWERLRLVKEKAA